MTNRPVTPARIALALRRSNPTCSMPSEEATGQREREGLANRKVSSYFSLGSSKINKQQPGLPPPKRTSSELGPPSSAEMTAVETPPNKEKEKEVVDSILPASKNVSEVQHLSRFKSDLSRTQEQLPLPVSTPKRARIDSANAPGGLKVHWARFIVRPDPRFLKYILSGV